MSYLLSEGAGAARIKVGARGGKKRVRRIRREFFFYKSRSIVLLLEKIVIK